MTEGACASFPDAPHPSHTHTPQSSSPTFVIGDPGLLPFPFSGCRIGVRHDGWGPVRHSPTRPIRRTRTFFVIPAKTTIRHSRIRPVRRTRSNRHSRESGNPGSLPFLYSSGCRIKSGMTVGAGASFPDAPHSSHTHLLRHTCEDHHSSFPHTPSPSHALQSSFPRKRESRVVAFPFFWMPDRGPA